MGGININDRYSDTFPSLGTLISVSSASSTQLKIGDVLWKKGHIGIVIEKNQNQILVAEEKGNANNGGIFVTIYKNFEDFKTNTPFTDIISMDQLYSK